MDIIETSDLIGSIKSNPFIMDETKILYINKLEIICKEVYDNELLINIVKHPELFYDKLINYSLKHKGTIFPTLGDHAKESFISPIISLFNYNTQIKHNYPDLFQQWINVRTKIQQPITDKYNTNEPTERQQKGYIDFTKLIDVRDRIRPGSLERLLFSMYIEIPPVRSDYAMTKIYYKHPQNEINDNYIVLNDKYNYVCLEKYKTFKLYGIIKIDLPRQLIDEIKYSLQIMPRNYLFVSSRTYEKYKTESSFNSWANVTLKKYTKNQNITLTMLRHIYISRRDLEIEKMSGTEQVKIATLMGHSIEQQRRYLWHTWLNKIEFNDEETEQIK